MLIKRLLPISAELTRQLEALIRSNQSGLADEMAITSIRATDHVSGVVEYTTGYVSSLMDKRWCETDRLSLFTVVGGEARLTNSIITSQR